ncbi:unnamed protein product [Schistosoma haematobium]|nr:unnamed protein product [Schistosoma haematobium]
MPNFVDKNFLLQAYMYTKKRKALYNPKSNLCSVDPSRKEKKDHYYFCQIEKDHIFKKQKKRKKKHDLNVL